MHLEFSRLIASGAKDRPRIGGPTYSNGLSAKFGIVFHFYRRVETIHIHVNDFPLTTSHKVYSTTGLDFNLTQGPIGQP